MKYVMYILIAVAVIAGLISTIMARTASAPTDKPVIPNEEVACTMDAKQCPDGSYVGRTGPTCEFVCPPLPEVADDVKAHIASKADKITVSKPVPNGLVENPLVIEGKARGPWFFEASFPVYLTNWNGLIIGEGIATADGDWMTTEFVPFTASITFTAPNQGGPADLNRGTLILKKDNPSGLPENDDALEIPVRFNP